MRIQDQASTKVISEMQLDQFQATAKSANKSDLTSLKVIRRLWKGCQDLVSTHILIAHSEILRTMLISVLAEKTLEITTLVLVNTMKWAVIWPVTRVSRLDLAQLQGPISGRKIRKMTCPDQVIMWMRQIHLERLPKVSLIWDRSTVRIKMIILALASTQMKALWQSLKLELWLSLWLSERIYGRTRLSKINLAPAIMKAKRVHSAIRKVWQTWAQSLSLRLMKTLDLVSIRLMLQLCKQRIMDLSGLALQKEKNFGMKEPKLNYPALETMSTKLILLVRPPKELQIWEANIDRIKTITLDQGSILSMTMSQRIILQTLGSHALRERRFGKIRRRAMFQAQETTLKIPHPSLKSKVVPRIWAQSIGTRSTWIQALVSIPLHSTTWATIKSQLWLSATKRWEMTSLARTLTPVYQVQAPTAHQIKRWKDSSLEWRQKLKFLQPQDLEITRLPQIWFNKKKRRLKFPRPNAKTSLKNQLTRQVYQARAQLILTILHSMLIMVTLSAKTRDSQNSMIRFLDLEHTNFWTIDS
mgnify:CR=1 FL=1